MRRITTAISAAALSLSMALGMNLGVTQAATPGYDSAYQFESAFLSLKPGDSGTFSVFFANTGTTAWTAGSGTQVNLAVCAADKVTCNVTSAQSTWASGWLSSTAYATHTKSVVVPGDFSAFTYNIKVPSGTANGTYRFNGDLVLSSTGDRIHPEGYYQDGSISVGAAGAAISVTPAFSVDEDNQVSTAVPGNGQHTYTFQINGLTGTVDMTVMTSGNIVRNSDGTFSFLDDNADKKADGVCPTSTLITAVNGSSITPSGCVNDFAIPSSGTITVTIDSATQNQRVRVVMWQDLLNNGQIDLSSAGAKPSATAARVFGPYDVATDGQIAVSGRKFFFGAQGSFGQQFVGNNVSCDTGAIPAPTQVTNSAPVWRSDSSTSSFSAGPTSSTSLRFTYDSNDIFRIQGVQVTLAQWKGELTPDINGLGDDVSINYSPDPAGISEFNITCNHGADAPDSPHTTVPYDAVNGGGVNAFAIGDGGSDPTATVGDFDAGGAAEDVQIQFSTPDFGTVSSFQVQRANAGGGTTDTNGIDCKAAATPSSKYATIGSVSPAGSQATFTDFDRPGSATTNRTYCYRVRVQDPVTAQENFSIVLAVTVGIASADTTKPISTGTTMTPSSGGLANTLDNGDKVTITFSEKMSIAANAVIRVTDSDCGAASNSGPATCSGAQTNTVADVVCGTNATCSLDTTTNVLTITMTSGPNIIAAGSSAGAQFPLVITDSSGITDLAGNVWDLACGTQSSPPATACPGGTPKRTIG